jgi:integral membrane protein
MSILAPSALRQFLWVARLEGLSFLVLLLIAMPLKYAAGEPGAVRVVGMAHGILFVAYLGVLLRARLELGWSWRRLAEAFVASLIPAGTFWFERRLRRDPDRSEQR